jgi:hypothetical protein
MNDSFEILLEEKIKILVTCQEKKELKTCNDCEKILDCEIRDEYVQAVYGNMSKGKQGGFEF